jgi:hypothetical protein
VKPSTLSRDQHFEAAEEAQTKQSLVLRGLLIEVNPMCRRLGRLRASRRDSRRTSSCPRYKLLFQVHCHYSAIFLSPPFLPSFVEISNDSTKTGEKKNMFYDNKTLP